MYQNLSSATTLLTSPMPHRTVYTVITDDGIPVAVDIYGDPDTPTILIVPGFWRTRRSPSMVDLAKSLSDRGYSCAVMDCRGHGDSGGVFGFNAHEHLDVAAAVGGLVSRGFASSVVLMGLSAGGAIAVSAAARDELPVDGVLLVSAVADFRRVIPRPNPFTIHNHLSFKAFVKPPRFKWNTAGRLDALTDIAKVHVPVCLAHVRNDWLVHHDHCRWLYERAREPKELRILDVPGRYHADRVFSSAPEAIWPVVTEFLGRLFSGSSPASSDLDGAVPPEASESR